MDIFFTNNDLLNLSKKSEALNAVSVMDMDSYIFVILRILETAMKGDNRLWIDTDGLEGLEDVRKVLHRSHIQTDTMDDQLYIRW
jgi:hypothetical protein